MAKTEVKTPEELKKDKRTRLLTVVVVVFLLLVFVVGFIYGLNSVLAMEGSFPPNRLTEAKTMLYDTAVDEEKKVKTITNQKILNYLNDVVEYALTGEARVSTGVDCSVNRDENGDYIFTSTGSEAFDKTVTMLAGDVGKASTQCGQAVRRDFEEKSTDFGEAMDEILRIPKIKADDITQFSCTYIYYRCPSCGETSEDNGNICYEECPKCGSTYGYHMQYKDEYTIVLTLDVNERVKSDNFAPRGEAAIRNLFGDEFDGVAEISGIKTEYKGLKITFKVNRETDKLTYLGYSKDVDVKMAATFSEEWEKLGIVGLNFDFSQTDKYYLTWPSLTLSEHEMTVEPKQEDNLLATLICSEPTQMTVSWTSDNPEVVSVDGEGYLKAHKKNGESAVITASFEFNGKTYEDSCTVKVGYPVESTSMDKTKAKLNVGETLALTVKFSPSKATVQTVTWYTTDEKVAVVDDNGIVTAKAAGEATVYSLSDDGYFKSSCKVTVEDNG